MFKIRLKLEHAEVLAQELKKEFGVEFLTAGYQEYSALGEKTKMHRDKKRHVVTFVKAFILGVQTAEK